MAFDNLPQIDKPAINSAESIRKLMDSMNEANGFILRVEVPDKGCDYDVELIKRPANVSNWRFPLQLKSIENPKLVKDGKFISYSFETDRLGYLIRRLPAMGIVVLYDMGTQKIYFDYVNEIYNRVREEKGSDSWKQQETVSIHVPIANEMTAAMVEGLYQTFIYRFEQAVIMQRSNGERYNLPVIPFSDEPGFDHNNLDDIKSAIKRLGISFMLIQDIGLVFNLITRLPNDQIIDDKELLLIAALANSEAGRYADSVFYVERIYKRYTLTTEETDMVTFIQLKNNLSLGKISSAEFVTESKKMLTGHITDLNKVTLQLNILYYELTKVKGLEKMPLHLGEEIFKITDNIEALAVPENQKLYLKIWNAENISIWNNHFMNEGFNEVLLRESIESPLSLDERKAKAEAFIRVKTYFEFYLKELFKKAKKLEDRLAQAYVINLQLRNQLLMEISLIRNQAPVEDDAGKREMLIQAMVQAGLINHEFLENNLFNNAYMALCYQIEYQCLYTYKYHFIDQSNLPVLLDLKSRMEKQFEFDVYELSVPELLEPKKEGSSIEPAMFYVTKLNDEQLDTLAEITIQSNKYPNAVKVNIYKELKAYQLFYDRCKDLPYEVISFQYTQLQAYATPIVFKIKSKLTGIESVPDDDMERLLQSWGL